MSSSNRKSVSLWAGLAVSHLLFAAAAEAQGCRSLRAETLQPRAGFLTPWPWATSMAMG